MRVNNMFGAAANNVLVKQAISLNIKTTSNILIVIKQWRLK